MLKTEVIFLPHVTIQENIIVHAPRQVNFLVITRLMSDIFLKEC